jgi:hypothetical protein
MGKPPTTDPGVILTREAFARFWFRYAESAPEARLVEYAEKDPDASAFLAATREEIAEYWPMLVEECQRPVAAPEAPQEAIQQPKAPDHPPGR